MKMETELCNMCMITDAQGRVLVQERLPKPSNPWSGLTFPGGHVEPGEAVVASVIREVQEETGLTVSNLQNCGYIQWYNPIKQSQYFVFLFKIRMIQQSCYPNIRINETSTKISSKICHQISDTHPKLFINK